MYISSKGGYVEGISCYCLEENKRVSRKLCLVTKTFEDNLKLCTDKDWAIRWETRRIDGSFIEDKIKGFKSTFESLEEYERALRDLRGE